MSPGSCKCLHSFFCSICLFFTPQEASIRAMTCVCSVSPFHCYSKTTTVPVCAILLSASGYTSDVFLFLCVVLSIRLYEHDAKIIKD